MGLLSASALPKFADAAQSPRGVCFPTLRAGRKKGEIPVVPRLPVYSQINGKRPPSHPRPQLAHRLRKRDSGSAGYTTAPLISVRGPAVPQLWYPNPGVPGPGLASVGLLAEARTLDITPLKQETKSTPGLLLPGPLILPDPVPGAGLEALQREWRAQGGQKLPRTRQEDGFVYFRAACSWSCHGVCVRGSGGPLSSEQPGLLRVQRSEEASPGRARRSGPLSSMRYSGQLSPRKECLGSEHEANPRSSASAPAVSLCQLAGQASALCVATARLCIRTGRLPENTLPEHRPPASGLSA